MTNTYEIGRAAPVCAATGHPLTPGTPIVTALVEAPGEEHLRRVDTSAAAWEAGTRPPGVFAFWRTVVPEGTRKHGVVLDDEALMDLFHSLDGGDPGENDDRRSAFRYVVALLLVRRRRLIQVSNRSGGTNGPDILVLKVRGSEEGALPFEVPVPNLDSGALASATEQLSSFIETGT
jgi:hypothetical protein